MSKWTMEQLLEAAEEREAESAIRQAELEAAYEALQREQAEARKTQPTNDDSDLYGDPDHWSF